MHNHCYPEPASEELCIETECYSSRPEHAVSLATGDERAHILFVIDTKQSGPLPVTVLNTPFYHYKCTRGAFDKITIKTLLNKIQIKVQPAQKGNK